jgi:hypothetical protein
MTSAEDKMTGELLGRRVAKLTTRLHSSTDPSSVEDASPAQNPSVQVYARSQAGDAYTRAISRSLSTSQGLPRTPTTAS